MESIIIKIKDLSPTLRASMLKLMRHYYANITTEQFEDDLRKKNCVIVLKSGEDLCGFSTQVLHECQYEGKIFQILFSGDTIIDSKHRNSMALPIVWGKMMLSILEKDKSKPLYWLLTTKGYKTYRFLPVFFKRYFPNPHNSEHLQEKPFVEYFCKQYFKNNFDIDKWLVKARPGAPTLRLQDGEISETRRKNPDIAFFEKMNPGHLLGDELVCFARFHKDNLKPFIWEKLVS